MCLPLMSYVQQKIVRVANIRSDTQGAVERCQRCDREHFSFMWLPEAPQSTLKRVQPFFSFYLRQKIFPFQL